MSISATNSNVSQVTTGGHSFGKVKKSVDDLQQAIESGNLDDAKAAFAKLQSSVPKGASADSPIGQKIAVIGKALDSGDLGAAQTAVNDLKKSGPRRPDGPGGGPRPPGGAPPGGPPGGGPPLTEGAHRGHSGGRSHRADDSDSSSSSQSSTTDEAADKNHDGKVTMQEFIAYTQAQAAKASESAGDSSVSEAKSNEGIARIDTFA